MTPLTAEMLAGRAAAAPDPVADPDRWVYRKSAVVSVPETAREPEVTERWATADGTAAAAYAGGRLEMMSSPEVPGSRPRPAPGPRARSLRFSAGPPNARRPQQEAAHNAADPRIRWPRRHEYLCGRPTQEDGRT
jgi:hypothetical protein